MALTITQLPVEFAHVGNEIYCTFQTSLPLSTPNLRIRIDLVVETVYQVGTNVTIELAARKPNSDRRVRFHLHDHLRDFFARQEDIPANGGTAPARCNHLIRRYFIRAYEISGTVPVVTDIMTGGSLNGWFYAVNGAIAPARWLEKPYFNTGGWFDGYTTIPFYSWPQAQKIRTSRTQDQWSYLFYGKVLPGIVFNENFFLSVRITWDDLTTLSYVMPSVAIQGAQVWMIPCGFVQLGIPALEVSNNKSCLEYRVRVGYGTSNIYGPQRTYLVDHQYYEWHQEVQYKNGLGVFEQLVLRGNPTNVTEVERQTHGQYHQFQQPKYYGDTIDEVIVLNGKEQSSGLLDALEMRKFQEMLASPKVMVKDARLGWVPAQVRVRRGKNDPLNTARVVELDWVRDSIDTVVDMF